MRTCEWCSYHKAVDVEENNMRVEKWNAGVRKDRAMHITPKANRRVNELIDPKPEWLCYAAPVVVGCERNRRSCRFYNDIVEE